MIKQNQLGFSVTISIDKNCLHNGSNTKTIKYLCLEKNSPLFFNNTTKNQPISTFFDKQHPEEA